MPSLRTPPQAISSIRMRAPSPVPKRAAMSGSMRARSSFLNSTYSVGGVTSSWLPSQMTHSRHCRWVYDSPERDCSASMMVSVPFGSK